MSKYDKELQTGTDEYEKAVEPLQKSEERQREKSEEPERDEERAER